MSRVGNKPVSVPDGVTIAMTDNSIQVKGAQGDLSFRYPSSISIEHDTQAKELHVRRPDDARQNRAMHGMVRAIVNNMVAGVQTPFVKKLEIQGVGYNAQLEGKTLKLQVGFANTIRLEVPSGVTCTLANPTQITVSGPDRQAVGQFAANIRRVRPPEPYKGKGIRYEGELVRRKAGKAAAGK